MAASQKLKLRDFSHRVAVCSMDDVVTEAGVMTLRRKDVYHAWASVVPSVASSFSKEGQAVKQSRDSRTHKIYIRMRRDIDFTVSAWLYEARLQSPPRWFKILSYYEYDEEGQYLALECRLVERNVNGEQPAPVATCDVAMPLPQGVVL